MINPVTELRAFFEAALVNPVENEPTESAEALVQRRWSSSVALAVGSFMLAWSLRVPSGDPTYYAAVVAVTATWIVGGLVSGRVYLGPRRGIVQAIVVGALLLAVFLGLAALLSPVPVLHDSLLLLLGHFRWGILPITAALALLNSVGEELFFRGSLFAAVGGRQALLVTTLVYAVATIPTGIPMLVLAAGLLGFVTGLQRRATGGVLAPMITHVIWTLGMIFLLPLVLGA
ncbi:MAG: CPBP family intramembrane metalloprotease [Actinobacteria bacterium]|nr:CPBP family intramembrane metalloprotease [Actinomycetota bacterium]